MGRCLVQVSHGKEHMAVHKAHTEKPQHGPVGTRRKKSEARAVMLIPCERMINTMVCLVQIIAVTSEV